MSMHMYNDDREPKLPKFPKWYVAFGIIWTGISLTIIALVVWALIKYIAN